MVFDRSYIAKRYINSCFSNKSMERDPKVIIIYHCNDDPNKYEGISGKFILNEDIILLDEKSIKRFEYYSSEADVIVPNTDDIHISPRHSMYFRHNNQNPCYNFNQDLNLIPTKSMVIIIDISPLLVPYVYENITYNDNYSLDLIIHNVADNIYKILGAHPDEEIEIDNEAIFKIKKSENEAKIFGGKFILADMSKNIDKVKKASEVEDIQVYPDGTVQHYYNKETLVRMDSSRDVLDNGKRIVLDRTTKIIKDGYAFILDEERIIKDYEEKSIYYKSTIYDKEFEIFYKDDDFTIREKMLYSDMINGKRKYYSYSDNGEKQYEKDKDEDGPIITKANVESLSSEESAFVIEYSSGVKIVDTMKVYDVPNMKTTVQNLQYLFKDTTKSHIRNLINTANIISQNDIKVVLDCDNTSVESSMTDMGIKMDIGDSIKRSQTTHTKEGITTTFIEDTLFGSSHHNKNESKYSFTLILAPCDENRQYSRNIFGVPYLLEDFCKELS